MVRFAVDARISGSAKNCSYDENIVRSYFKFIAPSVRDKLQRSRRGYFLPLAQAARTRLYAMFDKRLRHIPTPQFHTSVLQAIDKDNIAKIN